MEEVFLVSILEIDCNTIRSENRLDNERIRFSDKSLYMFSFEIDETK